MNHLDNTVKTQNRLFLRPADLIVNTLAVVVVCGLIYKGTHALFDVDSGFMFRSCDASLKQK